MQRTGRQLATIVALVLCGSASGCGGASEADASLSVTADSSGPYPVVRSEGRAPEWRSSLVTTVGTVEGGPGEFGRIRSVLLRGDGALFVVDPGYVRVAEFDSTGAFVAQWGRRGAGPGEYASPYSIAWLGDSLVLLDPGNSRFGLFDPARRWVRSWQAQRITGGRTIRLYREPPGAFWSYATRAGPRGLDGIFVRYTSAGPVDTVPSLRAPAVLSENAMCETPDRSLHFFDAPFGAAWHLLPTPTAERAVNVSTEYRVAFLDAAGDTMRTLERHVAPTPITDAEWEASLEEWRTFREKTPDAKCTRDGFSRPAAKPVVESLFFDDTGRLWVEVLAGGVRVYDVFETTGRLIASVSGLPPTGGIEPSVVAGRIALVVPDSAGVPFVQVHRVHAGPTRAGGLSPR